MEETFVSDTMFPATGTGLGSVVGIDVGNGMPFLDSLVFDESLQLTECPPTQDSIKLSSFALIPDSGYVLHNNESVKVADNFLTDTMVNVPHKPCLSATNLLEMPFGRFRAFGLKSGTQFDISSKFGLNSLEELLIAGNSEFAYADINTDNGMRAKLSRLYVFSNEYVYEVIVSFPNNVCSASFPIKIFMETFWNINRHLDATLDGGHGNNSILEPIVPYVIPDRDVLDSFGFSILCDNADCLTGELGWENGGFPNFSVTSIMDGFESSNFSMLESYLDSTVELYIGVVDDIAMWKFDSDNGFGPHIFILTQCFKRVLNAEIPLHAKARGFLSARRRDKSD
jgi:hypothetical protein